MYAASPALTASDWKCTPAIRIIFPLWRTREQSTSAVCCNGSTSAKKLTDGPFDLFSDIDSRIRHLERVGNPLLVLGLANLAIGITNSIQANAEYAWINLLCATLLMYGLGRIHGKKEALEKERLLRE